MRSRLFALTEPERLEQLTTSTCLLDRIGGERVTDRVADTLGEKGRDPCCALYQTGWRRAGLGPHKMERMVEGLRGEPVGLDHDRDVGGLDRDLHVLEPTSSK